MTKSRSARGKRTHPLTTAVLATGWSAVAAAAVLGTLVRDDAFGGFGLLALGVAAAAGVLVGASVGWLTWLFTRYSIDSREVRVESGMLFKKSRRVPFERLQSVDIVEPLLARILGLAELRIDSAGGSESRTVVRYLPVAEARELRRLLMTRAGAPSSPDGPPSNERREVGPPPPARASIAEVTVNRIVIGTLLSLDFLAACLLLFGAAAAALWFSEPLAVIGGLLGVGTWIWQIITSRILAQWGYRLSRVEHGLRIRRGLLTRTSQTIPFDRVQGVVVIEPLFWRAFGWRRIEVDVAGTAGQNDREEQAEATVLPITDLATAARVIDQLVPGAQATPPERVHPARRGWPLAPMVWRWRWIGSNAAAVVSSRGWMARRTVIVPHRKTQSVEVRQGPLQRWLDVATVTVHSPGPAHVEGVHLPVGEALTIARDQVARARAAR